MNEWKAVRKSPTQEFELYNLKDDIGEKNNVADLHPHVISEIEKHVQAAHTDSEYWELKD